MLSTFLVEKLVVFIVERLLVFKVEQWVVFGVEKLVVFTERLVFLVGRFGDSHSRKVVFVVARFMVRRLVHVVSTYQ